MSLKVSQLIGMDIYADNADYLGKVFDVILDLEKGSVVRLTMEPIRASSKEEAKKIFHERTVMYDCVKAVEKIVLVSSTPRVALEPEPEPKKQDTKKTPFYYRRPTPSFGK